MVSPLAFIHPSARLAANVEVAPFACIEANVEIGEGTTIGSNATICSGTRLGKNCRVFPGAVIGAIPQDLKFNGEITYVEIGDRVNIRECATINRGTKASGKGVTKIGNDVLIMSYVHVAHDCHVGNHCILVSFVGIAGETDVDDWAIIGGGTKVHQFTHIGAHAMVGGGSAVNKDIPPYSICGRLPIVYAGVNLVGLRRRGFDSDVIRNIKDMYEIIYFSGYNFSDAVSRIDAGFPDSEEKRTILRFITESKRGIVRAGESHEKGGIE